MKPLASLSGLVAAALAAGAAAQEPGPAEPAADLPVGRPGAAGIDVFYQTDADNTEVLRIGFNLDARYDGPRDYLGLRVEKARFNPQGRGWQGEERFYLRAADSGGRWKWAASVGTDGNTILGSASVHDEAAWRKELFVERDILETRQGLDRGIYYTFAGGAVDVPVDDRTTLAFVAGAQEFTGRNLRLHLRGNLVHVVKPESGLSVQLRTRWFRNSHPREFDYYSPEWYVQALPILQMRRTTDSGWRYLIAGGVGVQKDSASDWRRASYFNAQATSPEVARGWSLTGNFLFTETPTGGGPGYRYVQLAAGVVRAF
jgi:hypothetical protein